VSHALLPAFTLAWRLDVAETVGMVVTEVAGGGCGVRPAAERAGVPYTTARGWVRRFRARAAELGVAFAALAVELGGEAVTPPAGPGRFALTAIGAAFAAAACPGHEGAGVEAGAGPGGEPVIDLALGARGEAGAVISQPGDQDDRCPDLVVHVVGLLGSDMVPGRLAAQPPQVMPGREAAHGPALGGIGDLAGPVRDPLLELGEALVADGQDAARDEDLAQVPDGLARREAVKVGMAGRPGGHADIGDHPGGGARGQPLHQRGRAAGGQHVIDSLGVRVHAALIMGQQAEQVLAACAADAQSVMVEMLGGPAAGAGPERGRVLAVARAA